MLRMATTQDLDQLVQLRCAATGAAKADAEGWVRHIAGVEHILVLQRPGQAPAAMLGAVPVEYGARHGVWFCGMAAQPGVQAQTLFPRLLDGCLRAFGAKGYDFAVIAPEGERQAGELSALGFQNLFPLRVLRKPIERDLLAQAEFDSLTVRRLQEMRLRYQPGCITLTEQAMNETMTQLYRRGLTVVSNRRGYGLYYVQQDTLQFLELQADNDHCADVLLQAAREKTGAGIARILLAENQALYLGAGRRCGYGMIAFLRGAFPAQDVYFRMLL